MQKLGNILRNFFEFAALLSIGTLVSSAGNLFAQTSIDIRGNGAFSDNSVHVREDSRSFITYLIAIVLLAIVIALIFACVTGVGR